jgi:hypothetical protein
VTVRSVATGRAAAIDLSDPVAAADLRGFGLTDAAPTAVTETLRLIAEIAMDKAKAEALRRFRQQVVKRVCTELSVKAVFGGKDEQLLLPATCGQLDNLRLGDLGGSARGLVDALRADLAGVVLTKLLDEVVKGATLDGRVTAAIRTLVSRAATGELTGAEVRAALVAAVHDLASNAGAEAKVLATIVTLAARCAQQGCTVDDLAAALTAALPAAAKDQLATAAAAVARLREVLAATGVTTARDQAAAVVAVIATRDRAGPLQRRRLPHPGRPGARPRPGRDRRRLPARPGRRLGRPAVQARRSHARCPRAPGLGLVLRRDLSRHRRRRSQGRARGAQARAPGVDRGRHRPLGT